MNNTTQNPLCNAAIAYATRGFAVFPCAPCGKPSAPWQQMESNMEDFIETDAATPTEADLNQVYGSKFLASLLTWRSTPTPEQMAWLTRGYKSLP
jgi:hypothetical protein